MPLQECFGCQFYWYSQLTPFGKFRPTNLPMSLKLSGGRGGGREGGVKEPDSKGQGIATAFVKNN